MAFDFKPSFDQKWDTPAPAENPPQQPQFAQSTPKPVIETFDVDDAFANYKPSFKTTATKQEVKMPDPVPPVENLEGTVAAEIFGKFCKEKFGFDLKLSN